MSRFFIYAVIVMLVTSGSSWMRLGGGQSAGQGYRGSVWSSNIGGGGGSYGGGSGGGGHK